MPCEGNPIAVVPQTDAKNEKYAWLNQAMWVASGLRSGRQGAFPLLPPDDSGITDSVTTSVIYDAYLIE